MIFRRLMPLVFLATLALGGCEKDESTAPADIFLDGRWMLASIDNSPVELSSYSGTAQSYIEFQSLGKAVVGLGPCNNFSGRFALGSGKQLTLSTPIPTRVACPVQFLETQYLDNLALTARYEISGNKLLLFDATAAAPWLTFRRGTK